MNLEHRVLDLVEEVGELCRAILIEKGYKGKKGDKSEIPDAIVDILFDLILLVEHYKIDIDKEYSKMIEGLKKRQKRGEFK